MNPVTHPPFYKNHLRGRHLLYFRLRAPIFKLIFKGLYMPNDDPSVEPSPMPVVVSGAGPGKKQTVAKTASVVLITIGSIGYAIALFFGVYAIYFMVDGSRHPNAAEDEPGGLDGLGFLLAAIAAAVSGGCASVFFVPGMMLRTKLKNAAGPVVAPGQAQRPPTEPNP
jgi:hypothetical protein